MKRFSIFLLLLIAACVMNAQVSTENYIRTRKMLNDTGSSYLDDIAYYDGLGRPFQTVQKAVKNGSPVNKNLATLQEYDATGREGNSWLPIPTGSSVYLAPATFKNSAPGKYSNDSRPYSQPFYEASPLNRILQQYGPGTAWYNAGRPVKTEYLTNTATLPLNCRYYTVNDSYTLSGGSSSYAAGQLSVVKTMDEDMNVSYSFTDKLGHLVLTRQIQGSEPHDTYYVYDEKGNLCFVLQPMYQSSANLDLYAFQYKYDGRNRCVYKKLPGAKHITYTYNDDDQLIYSQDGRQRSQKKLTFYEYDLLRRLIRQGECTDDRSSTSDHPGPNGEIPTSASMVYIQNYYDDYSFAGGSGFPTASFTKDTSGHGKGFLTGSSITVFGTDMKIYVAHYYDIKGRETKTVQSNLLGGYDVTVTTYTFTDKPATVTHTHTANGKSTWTEVCTYTYDHANRISKVQHTFGGTTITLYDALYDDLGRLKTKSLHGSTTNKLTYTYNLRSWLTEITGTRFTQNMYYNTGVSTAKYNGSISSMTWKAGNESTVRGYKFTYDGLDRLQNAIYGESANINANTNRFSEKVTAYDKNGNILALQRYGQTSASVYGLIDNLAITLNGNQLKAINDAVTTMAYNNSFEFKNGANATTEYMYDANGNLTKDLNKNITDIQYNFLNLPETVTFSDGSTISYLYSADGVKLRTIHKIGSTTTTTYYCNNVVYENGVQKLLLTEEGYLSLNDSKYHYYLKDHQGNNRVVINHNGNVEETNHYYPFGGVFASSQNVQPYKYNGKELDTKKGLNWYDYGARHYDATLGRFTTTDRFAEKYYSISPYQYGANNPIGNIDINGDSIVVLNHGEGMHMAMLIQNNDNKWQYFSVNGDNVYISGKFFGGRKSDDIAVGEFNSPQDFFESSYNSAGNGNEDANSINGYGFSEGYIIPTTAKQDNMMRTTFENISQNEEYDLLGNNCSTTVQRSMEAVGIKTYDMNMRSYKVPASHSIGESSFVVTHADARPIIPRSSFKSIIKHNPQGNMIYRIKKR
ncbi:DUF6443 domain-containing protein [Bacteroides stercorirosoris]|uniref:RHS repeat-associated core domain-containing protein n=1 Tax=Bacteroides stercorirosoris TaxID=871324 RepID=A0A1M6AJJ8_9BACE|nr:DUF6443 domain-containing protein [Bacteroides stercorirosoris]SHI36498.1 RHS repeat-associated core domain-containing protein [Bacteroides stercorirosoris]